MLTNRTSQTASGHAANTRIVAATTNVAMTKAMWQPCVGVSGVPFFNRPSSLPVVRPLAGYCLQECVGRIDGTTTIKDRHSRKV